MYLLCLYFILFISIFLHEFSHYITSKIFKVPVYIFAIGNGPLFFSFNLLETHFQVRSFPLSGYIYSDENIFDELNLFKKYIIILSGIITNGLIFLISLILILQFDLHSFKYYILSIIHTIYSVLVSFTLDSFHLAELNFNYLFYNSKNYDILTSFTFVNIILSISNLIPIPPFDGSKVLLCTMEHIFSSFKLNKSFSKK